MRVRLAPGVDPERAILEIKQIAGNVSTAIRTTSEHPVDKQNDYVRWATATESSLESVLRREDAESFFANPRHQAIYSMAPGNQLTPLIYAEINAKRRDLEETAAYLEGHLGRMRRSPRFPIVVDSNVLIESQRLDNVDWAGVVKEEARVMIPLRVLEEIDAKKYSDSKRLRQIARALLPWIDRFFARADAGPVELRAGTTMELLLAERPRHRPSDADEEVLDVAHDVLQFVGGVKIMTGDAGMRARARAEGLGVLELPDQWRRRDTDDSDSGRCEADDSA